MTKALVHKVSFPEKRGLGSSYQYGDSLQTVFVICHEDRFLLRLASRCERIRPSPRPAKVTGSYLLRQR